MCPGAKRPVSPLDPGSALHAAADWLSPCLRKQQLDETARARGGPQQSRRGAMSRLVSRTPLIYLCSEPMDAAGRGVGWLCGSAGHGLVVRETFDSADGDRVCGRSRPLV